MTNEKNFAQAFADALYSGNTERAAAIARIAEDVHPGAIVKVHGKEIEVKDVIFDTLVDGNALQRFGGLTYRDMYDIIRKFYSHDGVTLARTYSSTTEARNIRHMLDTNPEYAPLICKTIARNIIGLHREKHGWSVKKSHMTEKGGQVFAAKTRREAEQLATRLILKTARHIAERMVVDGKTGFEEHYGKF